MKKLTIPKVRKIFVSYLKKAGYKEKTIKYNESKIEIFFEYLKKIINMEDVRDTDSKTIEGFLAWMGEKVSDRTGKLLAANTKRNIFSITKLLFKCLYTEELILVNPVQNIIYKPKGETKVREILTSDEMDLFLDRIDEDKPFGLRDKAMFEFAYSSGLRAGDISNLNAEDVDFEARMVLLKCGKFSKDRVVPVSKVAIVFLKKYLESKKRKTNILFTGPQGVRTSVSAINTRCKKWMKESGVYRKGLCAHSIRHSTAVHLLLGGADLRYVQELLGHESIETTVTYTHDLHENIRRVYKTYHPRENSYFKEIDEDYLERLKDFKEELSKQKRISMKRRKIKKRYYARNRDTLLGKLKREYWEKKGLTEE